MKFDLTFGLKNVIRDLSNYHDWIQTIKQEKNNPQSLWHKYNLDHNKFYTIYLVLTLPDEDKNLTDYVKRLRVIESLSPVNRYLDDLGFAESIVPEFNQIVDNNTNQLTLSYGIVYRFAFNTLSLSWIVNRLLWTAGLITLFYFLPWTQIFSLI